MDRGILRELSMKLRSDEGISLEVKEATVLGQNGEVLLDPFHFQKSHRESIRVFKLGGGFSLLLGLLLFAGLLAIGGVFFSFFLVLLVGIALVRSILRFFVK